MSLITAWTYPPEHLQSLKWRNRLVFLFAANSADPQLGKQLAVFQPSQSTFEDRDLLVFTVKEKDDLRERFKVESSGFTLILIGKDGSEKLRRHNVTAVSEIVQLIDSMPMRQAGGR